MLYISTRLFLPLTRLSLAVQTEDLVEYTGYAKNDIYTVASKIAERIGAEVVTASQRELLAVKKKYDTRKYFHVSTDVIDPEIDHLL